VSKQQNSIASRDGSRDGIGIPDYTYRYRLPEYRNVEESIKKSLIRIQRRNGGWLPKCKFFFDHRYVRLW